MTTIPRVIYKGDKVEYEGGIAFQKFLNLERCEVCLPLDYEELKTNTNLSEVFEKLLSKSDYLDLKSCAQNEGYFFRLNNEQREKLVKVISDIDKNPELLKANPRWASNKSYFDTMNKLKNKYFETLNFLIAVLEKIRDEPFVSNKTLNSVGLQTKNLIDELYNYVNYYYVYATLFLIKSEYKLETNLGLNQLEKIQSTIE